MLAGAVTVRSSREWGAELALYLAREVEEVLIRGGARRGCLILTGLDKAGGFSTRLDSLVLAVSEA